MNTDLLSNLFLDFWSDMRVPGVAWQIGTLAGCLVLGWLLARGLRLLFGKRQSQLRVVRLGFDSFGRVLTPLLTLLLIVAAKPLLLSYHLHVNLLRLAIPLVGSFALIRLGFYIVRRIFARNGDVEGMLASFEKAFALLVWLGVALYITGLWPEVINFMDDTVLPVGRYKMSLLSVVQGAIWILLTLILALWIGALLEDRLMQISSMHLSLRTVVARLSRALLVLVAVLVSLSVVGIDLTVLSVFGGALGVGIGLGLQKIFGSYLSGFVILLERSLAIGDMVTVDKYYGMVTRINPRYTIIRSLDGIETVVPNDMLISGAVQNYSLSDRALRISTRVTVGYESDMEAVLAMLEQAAVSVTRVSTEPAPQAILTGFGSDGLDTELGFWIADPENGRLNVLSEVNLAIWRILKQNHISIPFPQREVRISGTIAPVNPSATAEGETNP